MFSNNPNDQINGPKVVDFVAHSSDIVSLKISQKSQSILATGGIDAKINIWSFGDKNVVPKNMWSMGNNKSPIESLCFDDDENCIVSGAKNGSIKVFDLKVGKLARTLRGHQVNTSSLHYHPYGEFIVSGSADTSMKVWDVRQKTCIQTYSGHEKEVTCVKFSPDGRWVASSGKDGQLLIWDLVAGKLLHSVRLHPTYISTFEFNPTEFMLAAVTSAKTVRIWDLEIMKQIGCTYPDSGFIKSLSFSGTDSCLFTATNDSVKLWNWEPVKLSAQASLSWDGIVDTVISNDAKNLYGGSFNSNVVTVWNIDIEQLSDNRISKINRLNSKESISTTRKVKGSPSQDSNNKLDVIDTYNNVLKPPSKAKLISKNPNKIDINDLNIDEEDNELFWAQSPKQKQSSIPEVRWESEAAAKDMATSIGDSLWNKLSLSKRLDQKDEYKLEEEREEVYEKEGKYSMAEEESEMKMKMKMAGNAHAHAHAPGKIDPLTDLRDMLPKTSDLNSRNKNVYQPSNFNLDSEIKADVNSNISIENKPSRPLPRYDQLNRSPDHKPSSSSSSSSSPDVNSNQKVKRDLELRVPPPARLDYLQLRNNIDHKEIDSQSISVQGSKLSLSVQSSFDNNNNNRRKYNQNKDNVLVNIDEKPQDSGDVMDKNLDKLLEGSNTIVSELITRLETLKTLRSQWEEGNVIEVISHLLVIFNESMEQSSSEVGLIVISDFLSAVELRGNGLNLDACVQLLPLFESLLNECIHIQPIILSVIHATGMLCEAFGDLISQTRAIKIRAVDLSGEERLKKCNSCHSSLYRIKKRLEYIRKHYIQNSGLNGHNIVVNAAKKLYEAIIF